jgi:hypothetical protein
LDLQAIQQVRMRQYSAQAHQGGQQQQHAVHIMFNQVTPSRVQSSSKPSMLSPAQTQLLCSASACRLADASSAAAAAVSPVCPVRPPCLPPQSPQRQHSSAQLQAHTAAASTQ